MEPRPSARHTDAQAPAVISILFGMCKAQIPALGAGALFLLLFCLLAYRMADPECVTLPLSMCALYLSALVGGIFAVRFTHWELPLSGLASGILTALLYRALCLLPVPASGISGTLPIVFFLLIPVFSFFGAILGRRKRKKASPHRRKH